MLLIISNKTFEHRVAMHTLFQKKFQLKTKKQIIVRNYSIFIFDYQSDKMEVTLSQTEKGIALYSYLYIIYLRMTKIGQIYT